MVTKRKPTIEVVYEFDLTKKNETELLDLQKALSQRLNAINIEKREKDSKRVQEIKAQLLAIHKHIETLIHDVETLINDAPSGYKIEFRLPIGELEYSTDYKYWE